MQEMHTISFHVHEEFFSRLSRALGKDVGILYSMKDYSAKFGAEEQSFAKTLKKLSRRMFGILGLHKQSFLQG